MKDADIESRIVAASPHSDKKNTFVHTVMNNIKQSPTNEHRGFVNWLLHLHKPAVAIMGVVGVALVGSAVYAAVQFAPSFVKIVEKSTNDRGATEYTVAGFNECSSNQFAAERFEVKSDAPELSDEEVQKILQARCEMQWVDGFVKNNWQTYGTNPEWKDGDTIYYTRPNVLGKVVSVTPDGASINIGHGATSDTKTVPGERLKAYAAGEEIALDQIKPGDTVFTITQVSETYYDYSLYRVKPDSPSSKPFPTDNHMQVVGLVALFKMSLPNEYYDSKQDYITELPKCLGNDHEYCVNTPYIDVYPRGNGEANTNPYFTPKDNLVVRQISGTVTELSGDTLILKSRAGNLYTVTVGDNGFDVYNRDFAGAYTDVNATLKVGSNVGVTYSQPEGADPKMINKEHVQMVNLMLESLNVKHHPVKPY